MSESFTLDEKIALVEGLIEASRADVRVFGDSMASRRFALLKSIATDLRGRRGIAASRALYELERRIADAKRKKGPGGYKPGDVQGLAEELIGRWPTVKQALEKFGAEAEGESNGDRDRDRSISA